jgi:general L-amino acid transport system permease protein
VHEDALRVFIEAVRGVPLITVLFMASVMLPLFLPPGTTFDKLLRALIGVRCSPRPTWRR